MEVTAFPFDLWVSCQTARKISNYILTSALTHLATGQNDTGSWEGGVEGNEMNSQEETQVTREKWCSKPQTASCHFCMCTHVWSSSLLNRRVAKWVTKNKTTTTQKPDILWLLKQGLKGWVAERHPVCPINLKSSEAKNIFSKTTSRIVCTTFTLKWSVI